MKETRFIHKLALKLISYLFLIYLSLVSLFDKPTRSFLDQEKDKKAQQLNLNCLKSVSSDFSIWQK